jgi:arylsulfatase A-like enzyme
MTHRPLAALLAWPLLAALAALAAPPSSARAAADGVPAAARPNILWLTTEDIGPQLGCYGDAYADTPNLDRFATTSLRYLNAWSNAPVCAPARTTIITGVYPTATGSEHMRSMTNMPGFMRMSPQVLREAGYYCTNNAKEDYNLAKPGQVWDESSNKAHWRDRPAGKPFFAVFNHLGTHESQIRKRPHAFVHDPAKAVLPAYQPDVPEVRQDWAQYYDNITVMDGWFAGQLKELADAGLADDTIVFFYGDHGSGMPRGKRSACNSGLRVPLLIHVPDKWKHLAPPDYLPGGTTDRLVSFVDLAPTLYSLAGAPRPAWVQGEAFMGLAAAKPRECVFGFRGRMDERADLVRSVRDKRYVYVRNFQPHLPAGQHNAYMFETPTTRVWDRLYREGKLKPPQTYYWEPHPSEELYDLDADKDEVVNLATSAEHKATLERLRAELRRWILETRDVDLLPEGEIHSRSKGSSPYEVGHDPAKYPLERILETAEMASDRSAADAGPELAKRLADADSAVRYWAATGLLVRGGQTAAAQRDALSAALKDSSPFVQIAAAEALGATGDAKDLEAALPVLIGHAYVVKSGFHVALAALGGIDRLGARAAPLKDAVAALPTASPDTYPTMKENVLRLVEHIDETLGIKRNLERAPKPQAGKKRAAAPRPAVQ